MIVYVRIDICCLVCHQHTDDYLVLFEDNSYHNGYSPPLKISQRFIIWCKDDKKKWRHWMTGGKMLPCDCHALIYEQCVKLTNRHWWRSDGTSTVSCDSSSRWCKMKWSQLCSILVIFLCVVVRSRSICVVASSVAECDISTSPAQGQWSVRWTRLELSW